MHNELENNVNNVIWFNNKARGFTINPSVTELEDNVKYYNIKEITTKAMMQ